MSANKNRFKTSKPKTKASPQARAELLRTAGRLLLVFAVIGFVYGVERLSSRLDAIPVDRVMFAGDLNNLSRPVLVERVTRHLAAGYIGLDLEAIQAELEQEAWVYRAIVERVWPRELKITIVEETPIAVWGAGGLLNHRGKIFMPSMLASYHRELPILDGPEGQAIEIMRQYRLMSQLLGDANLSVARLSMNERGSWSAKLNAGAVLVLGRHEPLEKLRRFMWVYREELADSFEQILSIDTRYVNGVAVAWRKNNQVNKNG